MLASLQRQRRAVDPVKQVHAGVRNLLDYDRVPAKQQRETCSRGDQLGTVGEGYAIHVDSGTNEPR